MSADLPLVSVVTPSYNQGRFIRATIESVLSQDYPNLEYIVMDGGSTDETAAVAREYRNRLTFISEPDRGQSHAINKGFARARGEIVSWLNSDDLFLPGAVRHAVEALRRSPEAGAVYGEGYQIDVKGDVISRFAPTQKFDLWRLLNLSDFILQQTAFFRRAVFDRIGWLDESLYFGMDWEIFMRIGLEYPIEYVPEFMGAIREYAEAKTASGGHRRVMELVKIMRRHGGRAFPPGALVYGLPTYERLLNAALAKWPPALAPITNRIARLMSRVTGRVVGETVRSAQGWYTDGWASTRARLALPPPRARAIELDVFLPPWAPIDRQTIALRSEGRIFARESFGRGEFTIPIAIPRGLWSKPLHLAVTAERRFLPPAPAVGRRDRRKLCYLLRRVEFEK